MDETKLLNIISIKYLIMKPNEIVQLAIQKMNKRITNEIFLIIQNDKELMYQ